MMEMLFDEKVTLRRAVSRTATNRVTYQEVLASDGGPLRLSCKIERNKRWTRGADGKELSVDGTILFVVADAPELRLNDLVVDERGNTYRLATYKTMEPLTGGVYGSAGLALTRLDRPEDEHEPQVH